MVAFGVTMFPPDYVMQPVELACALEERGFESLFFPEHTHDPSVGLAAAAAVTEHLKLGTGICLIHEREPIALAKAVASLDMISAGRVLFGIGAGWNAEEIQNHGTPFADCWKITRERILAMREIWTLEAAELHGDYVNFDKLWSYPKPVQKGGPPVIIGANTKWAHRPVIEYGDGWMPIFGPKDLRDSLTELKQLAEEAGRDISTIDLGVFGVPAKEEIINGLVEAGFERLIFWLPPAPEDEIVPRLDRYAKFIESLN
jgi:probable F420-dependent oxidoreductase